MSKRGQVFVNIYSNQWGIMNEINSTQDFVTSYIAINADKYPKISNGYISDTVKKLSPAEQSQLNSLNIKDPVLALLLSFFFGTFAVDRFYLGNIFLGILKLITIGGLGIWTITDWFIIMKSTRKQNLEKFSTLINNSN